MKYIKLLTLVILVATTIYAFFVAITVGLDRGEEMRCFELKAQSEQHQQFYLTQAEKKMCDFHGIEINAPVK